MLRLFYRNWGKERHMRLQEVMTRDVFSIDVSATPDDAWDLMNRHRVHHLVVVDRNNIVGVISHRDLGGPNGETVRTSYTIGELMATNIVTAKPTTKVREAANLMRGNTIGCLPVLDGDTLVGIITVTDLLELLGRGVQRVPTMVERPTLTDSDMARSRKPHYDNTFKGARGR